MDWKQVFLLFLPQAATAVGVCVAAYKIWADSWHKRVDRTMDLLDAFEKEEFGTAGAQLRRDFPGLLDADITRPITEAEAEAFWQVSAHRDDRSPIALKYDVAREHLNRLAKIAFAYLHGTGDRKLLAAACGTRLVRSEAYFRPLIRVFGSRQGSNQTWQVISLASEKMKNEHPALARVDLLG